MENWLICWEGIASTKLFMVATLESKLPFTYVLKTKFSILLCTRLLLMKLGYLDFRNLELVVGSSELYSFLGLCGFCNEWYHYFDYPA